MVKKLSRIERSAKTFLKKTDWRLHTLAEGTKVPEAGSHGFQDASTDYEVVMGWLKNNPNLNIGAATGKGLLVLDLDYYNEGAREAVDDLEAKHGPRPETLTAITPSGGEHEYYRYPEEKSIRNANSFPPGIDVRADGGYIVLPNSNVDGVEYHWKGQPDFDGIAEIPPWMYEYFGSKRDESGRYVAKTSEEWSRSMQPVQEGGRHERITSIAGYLAAKGLYGEVVAELVYDFNEVNCRPPLPDDEVYNILEWVGKQHGGYHG